MHILPQWGVATIASSAASGLWCPFKCNAPGRHITGDAVCACFVEIQARGGIDKFSNVKK